MLAAPVTSKMQNYKLLTTGAFGNHLRSWRTVKEWLESDFKGTISLRYLGDEGGAWCSYDVDETDVEEILLWWSSEGADTSRVMVNESAPDDSIVIQGEFYNGIIGDSVEPFLYSRIKAKMRVALKLESYTTKHRLQSRELLHQSMTPSSWSDFESLLEMYPDHVLEVSVYGRCLGNINGRNALVWEVRRY